MEKLFLGIELGSTRIKLILINNNYKTIAFSSHEWENKLENNVWTYNLDDLWLGIQNSYIHISEQYKQTYCKKLTKIDAIGISGMMHGYLVFDKNYQLLTPFRTWRNTNTEKASKELTSCFQFNIPQRWSIAHLYQAILNNENHTKHIHYITTLSGYVHFMLTGEKVIGVGDASGMFPIDSNIMSYDSDMINKFTEMIDEYNYTWKISNILPKVLKVGENAGFLSEKGANLLDPSGTLKGKTPLCPPEGDAATGMVATNSITKKRGNISAGTSIFAMLVLDKTLSKVYPEIDIVTTPSGEPVAMVHCNNCTSDINSWISLFENLFNAFDIEINKNEIFEIFFKKALKGEKDCGGLLSYNYNSGEHITGFSKGFPLFTRTPESKMTLENFARAHIFSSIATLKIGMTILEKEKISINKLVGHGGFFTTEFVGQSLMASALNIPLVVMENANEGGAWGMAILAAYMKREDIKMDLDTYLSAHVFANNDNLIVYPDHEDNIGFEAFMNNYIKGLEIEKAAIEVLK